MKRISDIRGMDVISLKSEINLGKVRDVLIDISAQQIVAYSITESDLFPEERGVFIYDVNAIFPFTCSNDKEHIADAKERYH